MYLVQAMTAQTCVIIQYSKDWIVQHLCTHDQSSEHISSLLVIQQCSKSSLPSSSQRYSIDLVTMTDFSLCMNVWLLQG